MIQLSVIVVTFNAASTLENLLASFVAQVDYDSSKVEYLFIDGNSNDDTASLIASCILPNKSFRSEPDKGIYDAMNKGINLSSGKYLYFINADDVLDNCHVIRDILAAINTLLSPKVLKFTYIIQSLNAKWLVEKFKVPCHQAVVFPKSELRYKLDKGLYADGVFIDECENKFGSITLPNVVCRFSLGGKSNSGEFRDLMHGLQLRGVLKLAFRTLFFYLFGKHRVRSILYRLRGLRKL